MSFIRKFLGEIKLDTVSTPSNPPAGSLKLYFKSDGKLYSLDSAGTETELAVAGSAATTELDNLTTTALNADLLMETDGAHDIGHLEVYSQKSILFDGVDETISMGNVPELDFTHTEAFTASCWVKTTAVTQGKIMAKGIFGSPFTSWSIVLKSTGEFMYASASSGASGTTKHTVATINDGVWHHVAATKSTSTAASGVKLYIDGVFQASTTVLLDTLSGSTSNTAPFTIASQNASFQYFAGNVDDASVWDKELSAAEISEIYNSGTPNDLLEHSAVANLVGYWLMGDSDDTISTIKDRSVSGNDGTPANMESGDIVSDVISAVAEIRAKRPDNIYVKTLLESGGSITAETTISAGSLVLDGVQDVLTMTERGSAPATPATGIWSLYAKSDGIYQIDDAGAETNLSTLPSTGATTELDNLTTTAINTDLLMTTDGSSDVGKLNAFSAKSMLFDGVDERIDMGNVSELDFADTDPFSGSIWIKTTETVGKRIMGKNVFGSPFTGYMFQTATNTDDGQLLFSMTNSGSNTIRRYTTVTVNDGLWHHVAWTYDGSTTAAGVKIYIDGVRKDTTTTFDTLNATISNAASFNIGDLNNASSGPWVGNLDDASMWDKELSEAEIVEIYNCGVPYDLTDHSAAPNMVGYWLLGDSTDTISTIVDRSQNSNDGTPGNMEAGDIVSDSPAPSIGVVGESRPDNVHAKSALTLGTDIIWNADGGGDVGQLKTFSQRSMLFDGVDEYIIIPDDASLDIASNLSFSYWVKFSDTGSGTLVGKIKNTAPDLNQRTWYSSYGYPLAGQINAVVYKDGGGGSYNAKNTTASFNDNLWHHVTVTYDSSNNLLIYVDGVSQDLGDFSFGSPDGTIFISTAPVSIGNSAQLTTPAEASIDEVAVFSTTVLSANDVKAIYNNGRPNDISTLTLSATLVSWWRMGDGSGDDINTIEDQVGSNDGTPTNMEASDIQFDAPALTRINQRPANVWARDLIQAGGSIALDGSEDTLVISERASAPSVPTAGRWKLYAKSDGIYHLDDLGAETALGGGGSSFGTDKQIPVMNAGGTDFEYSANLVYNGTNLSVNTKNVVVENVAGANTRIPYYNSSGELENESGFAYNSTSNLLTSPAITATGSIIGNSFQLSGNLGQWRVNGSTAELIAITAAGNRARLQFPNTASEQIRFGQWTGSNDVLVAPDNGTNVDLGDNTDAFRNIAMFGDLLITEQGGTPATPSTNKWKLYAKSDGLYQIDDAGVETALTGGGGGDSFVGVDQQIQFNDGAATPGTDSGFLWNNAATTLTMDSESTAAPVLQSDAEVVGLSTTVFRLSAQNSGARIADIIFRTSGTAATEGTIAFNTDNGAGIAERMRINEDGKLLIGVTTSVAGGSVLEANGGLVAVKESTGSTLENAVINTSTTGNSPARMRMQTESASTGDPHALYLINGGTSWVSGVDNSASDKFHIGTGTTVDSAPKFTILTDGKVGIGDTAPSAQLSVNNGTGSQDILELKDNNSSVFKVRDPASATSADDAFVEATYNFAVNPNNNNAVIRANGIIEATDGANNKWGIYSNLTGVQPTNVQVGAIRANNAVTGNTSSNPNFAGSALNRGINSFVSGVGTGGSNVGIDTRVQGQRKNFGVIGYVRDIEVTGSAAAGISMLGIATTKSDNANIEMAAAGYFVLAQGVVDTYSLLAKKTAALIADNGDSTYNIFTALDNGTEVFQIKDGGETVMGKAVSKGLSTVSGTHGADATEYYIICDTSGGAVTVNLPAASTAFANGAGREYVIKDNGNAATNNVTINRNGSDTIDGDTSVVLSGDYAMVRLVSDGTDWFIVG